MAKKTKRTKKIVARVKGAKKSKVKSGLKSKAKAAMKKKAVSGSLQSFNAELKKIIDPHTGVNIVDMNLVKNVKIVGGTVSLDFRPTSPFCPLVNHFVGAMEEAAKKSGFKGCKVKLEGCGHGCGH
jgi:metal-sulfur cluster biosynthetic enzyme